MTIQRGQQWGAVAARPGDLVVVDDDAALHQLVVACREAGKPIPTLAVRHGVLARTLGARNVPAGPNVTLLPVDIVRVETDHDVTWAVSHAVARRSWVRGRIVAMMNAQYLGAWDVAPRAHPNDGKVDIVSVREEMPLRDRWRAWRRLPTGSHVPHPSITIEQVAVATLELERPLDIRVDGMRWRRAQRLVLTVEPDAITVCI